MSKNHFTYVNTPHDPVSISGSDPYSADSNANLACWYKVQEDHMIVTSGQDANGLKYISTIKDQSLNTTSSTGERDLNKGSSYVPVLASETTADGIRYIEGSVTYTGRAMYLRNASTGSSMNQNGESSTWIKGPNTDAQYALAKSIFTVMKNDTNYTSYDRPLTFTFGTHVDGDDGNDGEYAPFNLGIDTDADDALRPRLGWDSVNGTGRRIYAVHDNSLQHTASFHCLSLVYTSGSTEKRLKFHHQGKRTFQRIFSGSGGELPTSLHPGHHGSLKLVHLGGADYDNGGGYTTSATKKPGFAEAFAFEDGLSDIRRQQMESYICSKYDLELSSSDYLSTFEGGAEGVPILTSSLANPASNAGSTKLAREFVIARSSGNDIHNETVGGGFIRSSVSGSAYYAVTGSHASASLGISSRAWVRAGGIDDSNHAGSHVALVAKASSPFGHQMDNFKGYALKYGTFKDGADTDSLKIRLSARDARLETDGEASGFGDTDYDPETFTPTADQWCQIRMDVHRTGSVTAAGYEDRATHVAQFNAANACYQAGNGTTWENLFGSSAANAGAQTWSLWFKGSSLSHTYPRVFFIGGYSGEEHGIIFDRSGGTIGWMARYNNRRLWWDWNDSSLTDILDGQWHHILITFVGGPTWGDSTLPRLWVDNVERGSFRSRENDPDGNDGWAVMEFDDAAWNSGELSIGADSNEAEGVYTNQLANAAIWNKVLSTSEIASVYRSGNIVATESTATSNLIGHWTLSGSGSPLVSQDQTSNNNDMTAKNNVTNVAATLAGDYIAETSDGIDTIKVFARENGSHSWELLGTKTINNTANNFRYWKSDSGFDTSKVKAPNGIHNGYYVAMSSSNGQRLATTYYIDNYNVLISGSTSFS